MNQSKHNTYDVIVIGGGHAGTEAAAASARTGAATLLLTHNIDTLGQMSCNPAIGGIGKSHLAKEVDALDGIMAKATDLAGIQFRVLNARRGPAVQATRAQADRALYKQAVRQFLENQENLTLFQQGVDDLIVENNKVTGVVTQMGLQFHAKSVVLTVGTFLGGKIHIGRTQYGGGRAGDPASIALAKRLRMLPFRVDRLKTGTPPRIDSRSIDYSKLEEQPGDTPTPVLSYTSHRAMHPEQVSCHIAYTNERTHQIIRDSLADSPMFNGQIESTGPRYCPSIEDKIHRFADKNSHQIFVEPEGLTVNEIYPNGISTSLPYQTQIDFVRSMEGFENAHITRPGYAIEYDYFDPRDLMSTLETRFIEGLFFAGQINGTTGYEEAAAQGTIAGINASLKAQDKSLWSPKRNEAYVGVLIDDLTTLGTKEPYRMFTSRAEYRLWLREDNADLRLTEIGYKLGVVGEQRWKSFAQKREAVEAEKIRLKSILIRANSSSADKIKELTGQEIQKEAHAFDLLKRPEIKYSDLIRLEEIGSIVENEDIARQVETQIKYEGYLKRQAKEIQKQKTHENTKIPNDFDYSQVSGLSNEIQQKLLDVKPETIAQASRISGVTPAAVSLLLVYLKKSKNRVS